jgi:hypothetical protein
MVVFLVSLGQKAAPETGGTGIRFAACKAKSAARQEISRQIYARLPEIPWEYGVDFHSI